MPGLLADAHADAHLEALADVCRRRGWREFWQSLDFRTYSFADFGLSPDVKDSKLWQFCQDEGILLVTANRNGDGPDSLEATIRAHSTFHSLPILTIADQLALLLNREYAERAAIRLIEILLDLDNYRGAGRLYLPAES